MKDLKINGIQQLGVGVGEVHNAWAWYREHFSMDIRMFEEEAIAELMLPHTDGKARNRHAVLALNMKGGGGFEIWQHTGKEPKYSKFDIQLGDLGICIGKIKTDDIQLSYNHFKTAGLDLISNISKDPGDNEHFFLKDVYGNLWEVTHHDGVFRTKETSVNGGVYGAVIGVKDMDESLKVYQDLLQYDEKVYDITGSFEDWSGLPGGDASCRRVLLRHKEKRQGAFSPFFGHSEVELVQLKNGRKPRLIYEDRIWGDPGFIHLCFDVNEMDNIRQKAADLGFPFTVDSARATESFDMGEAAGNFAYIQAPEGTLIEFVETHKIPLMKKLGWYLDLRKRPYKPLPHWMLSMFRFMRVK